MLLWVWLFSVSEANNFLFVILLLVSRVYFVTFDTYYFFFCSLDSSVCGNVHLYLRFGLEINLCRILCFVAELFLSVFRFLSFYLCSLFVLNVVCCTVIYKVYRSDFCRYFLVVLCVFSVKLVISLYILYS